MITHNYANVPLQRNYRTNIYGNILTEQANFTVEIPKHRCASLRSDA